MAGVFIVPMRNWNFFAFLIKFSFSIVFIVPMRNWNIIPSEKKEGLILGFYRTYEELKLEDKPLDTPHD